LEPYYIVRTSTTDEDGNVDFTDSIYRTGAPATVPGSNPQLLSYEQAYPGQTANGYRLPEYDEWLWAAQGGVSASVPPKIYSGSDSINAVAWYSGNSGPSPTQAALQKVALKDPNELGIHDMSGNAWEFTWYPPYQDIAFALYYGGAYDSIASQCRVSISSYGDIGLALNARNLGLRPVANEKPPIREPEVFTIKINEITNGVLQQTSADTLVRRYGRGKKGIIFFSSWPGDANANTGQLADTMPLLPGFPFEDELEAGDYSMFLWKYPTSIDPFRVRPATGTSEVSAAIGTWFSAPSFRLFFPGLAKSVVDQIRARAPDIENFCLVGNSLGAGIVLQGYSALAADPTVRFGLIAPTEVFLPRVPGQSGSTLPALLQRTIIAADAPNDAFFSAGLATNYIAANSNNSYWPAGYVPPLSPSFSAHWIIGGDYSIASPSYPVSSSLAPDVFDLTDGVFSLNPPVP